MKTGIASKDRWDRVVPNIIAVLLAFGVIACMEALRHFFNLVDDDVLRQIAVKELLHLWQTHLMGRLEICHLSSSMRARIGSARTHDLNFFSRQ